MIHYLKADLWSRALKDPMTWIALAVDAVPMVMVIFFGWGASALVLLYWAENIVIGLATLGRLLWSTLAAHGGWGLLSGGFLGGFFLLHYGGFCFGHGIFIFILARDVDDTFGPPSIGILMEMFQAVLAYKPHMALVLSLMAFYQGILVVRDYWPDIDKKYPDPIEEMFSPYGRIIVLHIAIFAGAFALLALDDPMIGVLGLIVLRMLVSVYQGAIRGTKPMDNPVAEGAGKFS